MHISRLHDSMARKGGTGARVRSFLSAFILRPSTFRRVSGDRSAPRTAPRRDKDVAARPRLAQDVRSLGKSVQPAPSVAEGLTDIWYPAHAAAVSGFQPSSFDLHPLVRLGPGGDYIHDYVGGDGVPARDDDDAPRWIPGRPGGPLGPSDRSHRSYGGGIVLGLVLVALTLYLTIPRIAAMCH